MPYLKQLLIVSKIEVTTDSLQAYNKIGVKVEKFDGHKCERCWNYFDEKEIIGDICHRCNDVINK